MRKNGLDMLIHLGDVEGDEDYIPAVADCPVHMVRGNNDFFSESAWKKKNLMVERIMYLHAWTSYYVSMGETRKGEARGRGADIVMYGHTHRPFLKEEEDLLH